MTTARPPKLILVVGTFEPRGQSSFASLLQGFRRELIANLVRFREWAVRDGTPMAGDCANRAVGESYFVEASARNVVAARKKPASSA